MKNFVWPNSMQRWGKADLAERFVNFSKKNISKVIALWQFYRNCWLNCIQWMALIHFIFSVTSPKSIPQLNWFRWNWYTVQYKCVNFYNCNFSQQHFFSYYLPPCVFSTFPLICVSFRLVGKDNKQKATKYRSKHTIKICEFSWFVQCIYAPNIGYWLLPHSYILYIFVFNKNYFGYFIFSTPTSESGPL